MLTQCPHCTASFRVSDAQLQAAHGKVRCGACMEIFNASEHLTVDDIPVDKVTVASSTVSEATADDPAIDGKTGLAGHDSEDMFAGLDHHDDFSALAKEDSPTNQPISQDNHDAEGIAADAQGLSSQAADDSYLDFSETFNDLATPGGSKKSYQSEMDAERVEHSQQTGSFADLSIHAMTDTDSKAQFENTATALTIASKLKKIPGQHDTDQSISAPSRSFSKSDHQITALRAEPVSIKPSLRVDRSAERLKRMAWGGGILVVVAFIVLQLAWFQFDYLARQNYLRPIYQQACQLFGCKLPSPYDIGKIRSQNLVVRNHPLENKALIIDAIVINQAGFEQPFPDITFTFSDLNNQVIAKRVFTPDEYLSGEAENMQGMPANTPIHIALKIVDPGKKAVNYSMEFVQNQAYLKAD